MTRAQLDILRKANYVRAAQAKTNYWLDFSKNILERYISKYKSEFNLIVYSKKEEGGFYVIPFEKVKELFRAEFLAKDEKRRSNKRWVANIKRHVFKITNCSDIVDIKDFFYDGNYEDFFLIEGDERDYTGQTIKRSVNTRQGQERFREDVLRNFNTTCCISGINEANLLVASHIIPWAHNKKTRLDPANGLCLFVLYDRLFDKGYFTFNPDCSIKVVRQKGKLSKKLFELRKPVKKEDAPLRIGQIIFDPNGEYANENAQDKDGSNNPNALKNIWKLIPKATKSNEVVTYGITRHPSDPDRILMLLNFYLNENLQIGKEIIDNILSDDVTTYIKNFLQ